jgi:hypothetical protein
VLLKQALRDKETTKDDGEQRKGFAGIKERPAGKERELIKTVERWGQDGKRREKKRIGHPPASNCHAAVRNTRFPGPKWPIPNAAWGLP